MGGATSDEKNIVLPILQQDDPITLESLLYAKCFCSLKAEDEKLRCNRGWSDKVHEFSILGSAPKLIAVCTASNISSTVYCETLIEVSYFICLDSVIGDSCDLVTYTFVAIVIDAVYQLPISIAFY